MITPEEYLERQASRAKMQEVMNRLHKQEFKINLRDKIIVALESGISVIPCSAIPDLVTLVSELEPEFPGFEFKVQQQQRGPTMNSPNQAEILIFIKVKDV